MKLARIFTASMLLLGVIAALPSPASARNVAARSPQASESTPQYAVRVATVNWFDSLRARQVPAIIYSPAAKGPFPVIVLSHGLGRSPEEYAYLGNYWAGQGYVAVHLQHLGSDDAVWHGTLRPKKALREAFEDPLNSANRLRDVRFAIDQLQQMQRTATPLGARLDMARLGLAGNDLGAQTVLAVVGEALPGQVTQPDPRVHAVVAMSPPVPEGNVSLHSVYSQIHVPCLFLTGTEDDGLVGTTRADQRRLPFEYTDGTDQFLITFIGGDHMVYAGHKFERGKTQKDAVYQRLICLSTTAFWDAYLKATPGAKAWLTSGGLTTVLGTTGTLEQKLQPGRTLTRAH